MGVGVGVETKGAGTEAERGVGTEGDFRECGERGGLARECGERGGLARECGERGGLARETGETGGIEERAEADGRDEGS